MESGKHSMADSSEPPDDAWTASMSARERIRSVAETLHEPRSVNWISEQADTAWSTTKEELEALVDRGRLRRVDAGESPRYQPDHTRLLFEEIRRLVEENSREELRGELADIAAEIEAWQTEYGVETWEELEGTLADGDLSSEAISTRRDIVTYWRENEADRRLLKHALALYADVETARDRMLDAAGQARS
jgi:hypothetical protein